MIKETKNSHSPHILFFFLQFPTTFPVNEDFEKKVSFGKVDDYIVYTFIYPKFSLSIPTHH